LRHSLVTCPWSCDTASLHGHNLVTSSGGGGGNQCRWYSTVAC